MIQQRLRLNSPYVQISIVLGYTPESQSPICLSTASSIIPTKREKHSLSSYNAYVTSSHDLYQATGSKRRGRHGPMRSTIGISTGKVGKEFVSNGTRRRHEQRTFYMRGVHRVENHHPSISQGGEFMSCGTRRMHICGPAWTTSIRGVRHSITFADDATRRTTPPFMKEKGEATAKVKE